ncbi:CRISPR-associated endonuclease Cas1 [Candidatus Roizmanbacteria bacterium CG_4_10_14_3_um_filter_39_13]|uniref:CRISPR-associated endonuclease Cas1 n=2 Tax=Candidatus Roizmaniibacteriota TaxID=1752723 RepID=A0A2H0KL55_9BACT|nr:MAG: CRISPR-associated endonuclease Cas1 [Candidatus Roizmanbacteria bacterium CG11_big_fil_rev_8_21_14_0_20_37_16]PIX68402.1 MAG: CRISPR-associated endonuclease Cas1 [Candidatus Roizmanbacteria bacterium CG_4_10_14_3_um_filter_39_13]
MLTLPDFKEKKIVFIEAEKDIDHQIRFWNSNIRIFKDGEPVNQISCYLVLCIFIVGNTSLTTILIQKAQKYGISIFLLNYSLKPYAEIMSQAEGNTALRIKQYTMAKQTQLIFAKHIVENKVNNQFALLQETGNISSQNTLQQIHKSETMQELLGAEGNCASRYFQQLFTAHEWGRRAPQTKEDITNFLMDIGYTYLFNYVDAILRLFGFDTYKGFYHQLFFQRKSLTCDLMEPMRPLIDRAIIKGYNLGIINKNDFVFQRGSYKLKLDVKVRSKYSLLFFKVITVHKEGIYTYLRLFYLHLMNPEKYQFPTYSTI